MPVSVAEPASPSRFSLRINTASVKNILRSFRGKKRLIILLVAGFICLSLYTRESINRQMSSTSYLAGLSHFEDADSKFSAADVVVRNHLFIPTVNDTLNFGLSGSSHWVWLKLKRTDITEKSYRVELGYAHLDRLDVYRIEHGAPVKQYALGDMVPFNERPIKDRTFVIPVLFDDSTLTAELLFRARSKGSVQLPVQIKTELEYQLRDRNEQLLLGFYYGILLGVLAYNLLLAIGTREAVYACYCAYATFLMLFQFSQNGLSFEYIWPQLVNWHQISIPLFASLALLFCVRFTSLFLNISRTSSPVFFTFFRIIEGVFACLALASFVADRSIVITLVSVAVSLAGIFMLVAALVTYLKGDANARYYLLAWSILLFGIVIYSTKTLGIIPDTFITEYSVQIGSAFEMILLSYGLADRFNRLREENVRVHAQANATLESHVEQRTHELRQAMLQLEKANSRLEIANQCDPLTGIYNRRHFNEVLEPVRAAAADLSQSVSLMMIDIDHFKSINDTRGHLFGDEVIRKVARTIETMALDENCLAARFGGEEFVVLLPDYDRNSAIAAGEQLRKSVAAVVFRADGLIVDSTITTRPSGSCEASFSVTVSIGIATEIPLHATTQAGLQLIDQADQALYIAKDTGRNRCCAYDSGDESDVFAA